MANRHIDIHGDIVGQAGFTLVEIVVALAISGIVITMTMFTWAYISGHTTLQKRKSSFYAQAEVFASKIVNEIRTSPRIIAVTDDAITFVSRAGGDTVTYELYADSLRKNRVGMTATVEGASVFQFTIERKSVVTGDVMAPADPLQRQEDILLVITIGVHDRTGLTSVIPTLIKVRPPPDGIDRDNGWNF